jgi:hypothetical protein
MERLHYRSTSLVDIQAELHERELLAEARVRGRARSPRPPTRGARFGLSILGRRILG